MPYTIVDDVDQRPVMIDGVSTLGRRIAATMPRPEPTCASSTCPRSSARWPSAMPKSTWRTLARR